MKPIELTDIQKDKLLEMTGKLFPKYGEVQFLRSYMVKDEDLTGSPYLRWYDNRSGKMILIEIHWFEFCMTYLKNKILDVVDYSEIEKFLMGCLFQCEMPHPVDYLYEQFKKLK